MLVQYWNQVPVAVNNTHNAIYPGYALVSQPLIRGGIIIIIPSIISQLHDISYPAPL